MSERPYVTVVETDAFIADAERCLTKAERESLIGYVALNPTAGDLIPGAGGVRKLRWRAEGRGKRGGTRVIYLFHNEQIPLFLLTAYAKNRKDDLTSPERRAMSAIARKIVDQYSRPGRVRRKERQ